jgi:hypothetical protein
MVGTERERERKKERKKEREGGREGGRTITYTAHGLIQNRNLHTIHTNIQRRLSIANVSRISLIQQTAHTNSKLHSAWYSLKSSSACQDPHFYRNLWTSLIGYSKANLKSNVIK